MKGFGQDSQIGRPGQPSEIAPTYVFLASKEAELYRTLSLSLSLLFFFFSPFFSTFAPCNEFDPLTDPLSFSDGQIMHPYPMGSVTIHPPNDG